MVQYDCATSVPAQWCLLLAESGNGACRAVGANLAGHSALWPASVANQPTNQRPTVPPPPACRDSLMISMACVTAVLAGPNQIDPAFPNVIHINDTVPLLAVSHLCRRRARLLYEDEAMHTQRHARCHMVTHTMAMESFTPVALRAIFGSNRRRTRLWDTAILHYLAR
ncbi:tRNA(Ile)-lysidine synthetase [Anopheles sinensis]|uniref:tRNA(Ile)-lysidine synthetase n=1 Tax=Anopheles sinensis TaxID=74873 RepID=A0A084VKK2_ANOSI|nr:tRNA(Ile)-lysidine synthetase [Anopheles sinensis]